MICQKCNSFFKPQINIDGKIRNLQNRKFCFACSPFNQHNTRNLIQPTETKKCTKCYLFKAIDEFYIQKDRPGRTTYCKSCLNLDTTQRQKDIKMKCIEYLGSKCVDCGYVGPSAAYDFHHLDPTQKEFTLSRVRGRSLKTLTKELDKCVLLCAICHRLRHSGEYSNLNPSTP